MTTAALTSISVPSPAALAPDGLRQFTVAEYHRLISDGYFNKDDRFELLDGLIVRKMPRGPRHDAHVDHIRQALEPLVSEGWYLRGQCAITLAESEPEPDLALVRGKPGDYVERHPGPGDVVLVIEISDSSLLRDRNWKGGIYARDEVQYYWVISLPDRRIEVYSDPTGSDPAPSYRKRHDVAVGESVMLPTGGAAIEIAKLLL